MTTSRQSMHIDTDVCAGHRVCEGIRPDIFQVGGDGVAHIVAEELTEADRRDLEDAEYQCPTQALRLAR